MTEINQIHDKFFKRVFSDLKNTREFLKIALPKNMKQFIQLEKIVKKSKIDIGGDLMQTMAQQFREEGEKIGLRKGRLEGRQEGRQEGRYETRLETARVLFKSGVDINIISKATGFPPNEIEKIAKQNL